ncbi:hypothetical protein AM228_09515 [Planktothricoides sp. SR001]|uniref:hypothetical protein n=1 Tax=Planktothricoides sp. SR001 TaxID=1705388 RepID=UPI0006C25B34|nr:hypothetical protein [Planktothricoides sp. SR001]KOR37020.1 hypothetical protein AM228_09515 [Planktothricoides sp. SR001]
MTHSNPVNYGGFRLNKPQILLGLIQACRGEAFPQEKPGFLVHTGAFAQRAGGISFKSLQETRFLKT